MSLSESQLKIISDDIKSDPVLSSYPKTSDGAYDIATAYNAVVGQAPGYKMVNARHVLAELGVSGAIILDKLEAAASVNPVVKWAVKFLTTDGLDVGHPMSQNMLDSLAQAGVLTEAEANSVKALALQPQTRAEALLTGTGWKGQISYQDIEHARSIIEEIQ